MILLWPLASQVLRDGDCVSRPPCRLSWPVFPFQGRSWAVALAGRLLFIGLTGDVSSSR